eukprot:55804-Eustigmatos_ZCMA.PRE.1
MARRMRMRVAQRYGGTEQNRTSIFSTHRPRLLRVGTASYVSYGYVYTIRASLGHWNASGGTANQ